MVQAQFVGLTQMIEALRSDPAQHISETTQQLDRAGVDIGSEFSSRVSRWETTQQENQSQNEDLTSSTATGSYILVGCTFKAATKLESRCNTVHERLGDQPTILDEVIMETEQAKTQEAHRGVAEIKKKHND